MDEKTDNLPPTIAVLSCGCEPNATDGNGSPACAIHCTAGELVEKEMPRTAMCVYCKKSAEWTNGQWFIGDKPSPWGKLPFHKPEAQEYYCGCFGWD